MQSLGRLEPSFKMMGEVMPGFDNVALLKYPESKKQTCATAHPR